MNYGQRTCVVVLGMHRSGTSVLAATLHALGVDFGTRLLVPWSDNPKGYFEHTDLLHANIALLESFGLDRDGLFGELPVDWVTDERTIAFKQKIRSIIESQFSDSYIFGFKDPRISILLPAYVEVLQDLNVAIRCVVSERGVAEVAMSLAKRNGMSFYDSIRAYQYFYRIINAYTTQIPTTRIAYVDLITRTSDVVSLLGRSVHPALRPYADVATELNQIIDPTLQHHVASEHDVLLELASQVNQLQVDLDQLRNVRAQDMCWWQERIDAFNTITREQIDLLHASHAEKDALRRSYTDLAETCRELEDALGYVERTHESFKHNAHLAHIEAEKHKVYLENILEERDAHIAKLNATLTSIERSFTWKLVRGWDMVLGFLLPRDTLIRRGYDALIRYNQYVLNGWLPSKVVQQLQRGRLSHAEPDVDFWKRFSAVHSDIDILFVNHEESRTGAPRIVFDVAADAKKYWRVAMVSLASGSMRQIFEKTFKQVIHPDELYPRLSATEQATRILEQVKPRLVYVNSISTHHFARAAKTLGIPVIFHVHELDIAFQIVFSKRERAHFKEIADAFIAVSQPVYDLLVHKLDCDPSQVHLLHAFVDRERIAQESLAVPATHVQSELKQQPGEVVVLGLGMFIYRKGADIFMQVAKKLRERGVPCKFVWIGSKPFKEPFMADFGTYAPYFSLLQEKENPFPYLKAADIFVLPSREDPFPLVALEAMALGKPVVVFKDAGGIKDAVQDAGVIVDTFDVDAFADAVEKLVVDEVERQVLGSRGALRQLPYDSSMQLPKITALIEHTLEKKPL